MSGSIAQEDGARQPLPHVSASCLRGRQAGQRLSYRCSQGHLVLVVYSVVSGPYVGVTDPGRAARVGRGPAALDPGSIVLHHIV